MVAFSLRTIAALALGLLVFLPSTLSAETDKNKDFHANQVRRNRPLVEEVAGIVFGGQVHISCEVDYGSASGGTAERESTPEEDERVQMVLQVFGGEVLR